MEGAADIVRSIGQIRGVVRTAQSAMSAEARRGSQERTRIATQEGRAEAAAATASARERVRAEREASRAVAAEARRREQSERASVKERERAERAATKVTESEARNRTRAEEKAAREVDLIARRSAAARERAERQATRTTERETRARTRLADRERQADGRSFARGAGAVGRAAVQYAGQMHGEMQDARARRAGTEHTINSALYQVGVGGSEAAGMRQQIYARAQNMGMDSGELAAALAASQTQFNSLAGATPQARQAALNSQLDLADLAQSTYQSPAEVMRVAGMLGSQGVRGADQRRAIMTMTGMAQAGSIELGSMTSEALGPLMQNIARSVNANMSPAQRAAAVQAATVETMAVGEVTAAAGGRSRDTLNALAKTRGTLTDPRMQARLYERLTTSGHSELAGQMFDEHHRLRSTSAVGFMSQMISGMGGDANAAMSLMGSGGPGRPMVLDAQQRRLMLLLASQSASGGTIAGRVNDLQTQGARFSEDDVNRGREMVQGEQGTALRRVQEEHDNSLTDNTSAVTNLSSAIRDWQTAHPFAATAAGTGGGLLASIFGPGIASRLGAVAPRLAGAGGALVPGLGIAATAYEAHQDHSEGRSVGNVAGGVLDNLIPAGGFFRRILGGGGGSAATAANAAQGPAGTSTVTLSDQSVQALAGALRSAPITATVSAHDAAHAATTAASGRNPTPPAAR